MYQVILKGSRVSEVVVEGDLSPVMGNSYLEVYTQLQKLGCVRTRTLSKDDRIVKTFKRSTEVNGKYLDGFALRWKRAKDLHDNGHVHIHEREGNTVKGVVSSSRGGPDGAGYLVEVELDDGNLTSGECGCKDLKKNRKRIVEEGFNENIPVWNGIIVCKHILAMARAATKEVE